MRIKPQQNRAIAIWVMIVVMLIFIVVIGGIFYIFCKAINKLVPPPAPDPDGHVQTLHIGDKYQGGTVTGWAPHSGSLTGATNVLVYASDSPGPAWTNLVATQVLVGETNVFLIEQFTNPPGARFYNLVLSNTPPQ